MNLSREKAIEAMDTLTAAGYSAHVEAAVIRAELFYRVSVPALSFDEVDLRALCDLAEGIGLEPLRPAGHPLLASRRAAAPPPGDRGGTIVRVKADPQGWTQVTLCDDDGVEMFALDPVFVPQGARLDVRLPGVDWRSLITMT